GLSGREPRARGAALADELSALLVEYERHLENTAAAEPAGEAHSWRCRGSHRVIRSRRCDRRANEYAPEALGGCSSVGRALDCGSSRRGFNPRHSPQAGIDNPPAWPAGESASWEQFAEG